MALVVGATPRVSATLLFTPGLTRCVASHTSRTFEARQFSDQVIEVDVSTSPNIPAERDSPGVELLWQICYSIKFWLDWDADHVALVYTDSGFHKTGLVVSCTPVRYLRGDTPCTDAQRKCVCRSPAYLRFWGKWMTLSAATIMCFAR